MFWKNKKDFEEKLLLLQEKFKEFIVYGPGRLPRKKNIADFMINVFEKDNVLIYSIEELLKQKDLEKARKNLKQIQVFIENLKKDFEKLNFNKGNSAELHSKNYFLKLYGLYFLFWDITQ